MTISIEVRNQPRNRTLTYDDETDEWVLQVGGPGRPVVRSKTAKGIEEMLDWMDANKERKAK